MSDETLPEQLERDAEGLLSDLSPYAVRARAARAVRELLDNLDGRKVRVRILPPSGRGSA